MSAGEVDLRRLLAATLARAEKAEREMLAQASRSAAEMQMRRDCEAMALAELERARSDRDIWRGRAEDAERRLANVHQHLARMESQLIAAGNRAGGAPCAG